MAKLNRMVQKVFGLNSGAQELGKFGSLAAGSPEYASTPKEVQELANYLGGWFDAVLGGNSPALQDRNALDYLFGYQLSYLLERGIPEWDADTEYFEHAIVSSNGILYRSITDDNENNAVSDTSNWVRYWAIPTGTILKMGVDTAPNGLLYCDGSAVSRTLYADLFSEIGTAFGEGDGSTTFNIPDHRGLFARGMDDGASVDPDAASRTAANTGGNTGDNIGSEQSDATAANGLTTNTTGNHSHTTSPFVTFSGGAGGDISGGNQSLQTSGTGSAGNHSHTISGDAETRPKNLYFKYYIKY